MYHKSLVYEIKQIIEGKQEFNTINRFKTYKRIKKKYNIFKSNPLLLVTYVSNLYLFILV